MKSPLLVYFFLLIWTQIGLCQKEEVSIATYKMGVYGYNGKDSVFHEDERINSTMIRIQQIRQNVEFQLIFNKYSSVFKLKETIIPEGEELFYSLATVRGATPGTVYYKNIKDKIKIKRTESTGEIFLVQYPFEQFEWRITTETRIIHGYKCYKATAHWEEFDYSRKILLKSDPEVWFTNEIPFPFGPKGLDGLPGLVLEGTFNGKTFFYITKIQTGEKVKDKVLAEPSKGKKIAHEDYLKLLGELNSHRN